MNTKNTQLNEFVNWFRSSTPYINAFRNKTFVLYFGGELLADTQFQPLVHDIMLLHSLGVKLVLVHGARPQIEKQLKKLGASITIVDGLRVTDDLALDCVIDATSRVRVEIEALLSMGLTNSLTAGSNIHISSGNYVVAKPMGIHNGVDFKHTGEVRKIATQAITQVLAQDHLVLIPPLGYSPTGEVFNLCAEDLASDIAIQIKADKLVYLVNDKGVVDARKQLVREIIAADAKTLLTKKYKMSTHTARCVQNSIKATDNNVARCHLIDRHIDGGLLIELFSRDGCGSLISTNTFETIRQASIDDTASLLELLQPLEQKAILVRRSREHIETSIRNFTVIERDGMIIGCAALFPFIDEHCGELACLAVHPDYRNKGRGNMLLQSIEKYARQLGLTSLFVLTTQTSQWFKERGFKTKDIKTLPVKRRSLYNYQRNSKMMLKQYTD